MPGANRHPSAGPPIRSTPMLAGTSGLTLLADGFSVSDPVSVILLAGVGGVVLVILLGELLGLRYIPNDRVGVVEKLWSPKGSVPEGRILALNGEAGYQAELIRGGFHFGLWRWQFRIHKQTLVTVPQGQIAYVYARAAGSPAPTHVP